jgi:hypothetical protein
MANQTRGIFNSFFFLFFIINLDNNTKIVGCGTNTMHMSSAEYDIQLKTLHWPDDMVALCPLNVFCFCLICLSFP